MTAIRSFSKLPAVCTPSSYQIRGGAIPAAAHALHQGHRGVAERRAHLQGVPRALPPPTAPVVIAILDR